MSEAVRIRSAGPADVAPIREIARRTWHATYDDVLGPAAVDRQVGEWYDEATVRAEIENPTVTFLVAVGGGEVLGYASAAPTNGPTDPATARLDTIYVRPERWGEGVGSRLLESITDRLRLRGFRRVVIGVLADNDLARSFYEAQGFVVLTHRTTTLADEEYEEVVYAGPL